MTVTRYPNSHRSHDCDYTVQRDASAHYHDEASSQGQLLRPKMDVYEDSTMVIATFEIPGASRDKIAIEVSGNRLTISGEVATSFGSNQDYILRERKTGPFRRTLQLPSAIPAESIGYDLEDGVLTVVFPRIPPS